MQITTKKQAFHALDNTLYGIPLEAIEFLYNHPTDEEIVYKIQTALEQAQKKSSEEGDSNNTELWYAIVAENHLDILFLDSIINLLTQIVDSSSFLDEQLSVLIGLIGQKYGSTAVEKTLSAIENTLNDKNRKDTPFLYLFDILFYVDLEKDKELIGKILEHPKNQYATPFAITICYAGFNTFIPQLKKLVQVKSNTAKSRLFDADFLLPELKAVLKQLESGKLKNPNDALPYFKQRDTWKKYYQEHAAYFEAYVPNDIETIKNVQKTGRNEPCPCHSGKKYKKCCLKSK